MPLMNEEGDILDGVEPNCEVNDNINPVEEEQGVIEHGFEDANLDVSGFCGDLLNGTKHQNNLRDMFKVSESRKFEATGGANQAIALNGFAIRKTVDVKRLKHQLWDTMQPKLNSLADRVNKMVDREVEMTDENQVDSRQQQVSTKETDSLDDMTMSTLMDDLYFNKGIVNSSNVSVQSAFICLLHLANEKGLAFEQQEKKELEGRDRQTAKESNFKIALA